MIIPRFYEDLEKWIDTNQVLAIVGPHKVGKTTLIKHYLKKNPNTVSKVLSGKTESIQDLFTSQDITKLCKLIDGIDVLVIEEATYIPNINQTATLLTSHNQNVKVVLTGSYNLELSDQRIFLFPVSQMELSTIYSPKELRSKLEEFMIFGCLPEVLTAKTKQRKINILEHFVTNDLCTDILAFERVKGKITILNLLQLIALHVGEEISNYELGNQLKMDYKTVERYLNLLEKSFILHSLKGFTKEKQKEIHKRKKWYFFDNGILNAFLGNFNDLPKRKDSQRLWENFLIVERLKKYNYHQIKSIENFLIQDCFFWKSWSKHSIHLVEFSQETIIGDNVLYGYEFKWDHPKSKQEKHWKKAYPEAFFQVVHPENYYDFCVLMEGHFQYLDNRAIRIAHHSVAKQDVSPERQQNPTFPPNDPFFRFQWNLDDDGRIYGTGKGKVISRYGIQALKAWKEGVSGKGVKVAIISSGIAYEDYFDPMTNRQYLQAPDFVKTRFLTSLARDFSVDPPTNHANDWWGKGTMECDIIAATIHNQYGSCGIAYDAEIIPIKTKIDFHDDFVVTDINAFLKSLLYAADCGADIIMSQTFFLPYDSDHRQAITQKNMDALREAVTYLYQKGCILVTSSAYTGKYGIPIGTKVYPGAFPEVITVGCTRFDGSLTWYSNLADYISVYAPSTDDTVDLNNDGMADGIYKTDFWPFDSKGDYCFNQRFYYSTSANPSNALAEVSAVAALIKEKHPDWMPDQVKTAIVKSAKPFSMTIEGRFVQYGVLDAYGAVTYNEI